jgi:hypothetical protein
MSPGFAAGLEASRKYIVPKPVSIPIKASGLNEVYNGAPGRLAERARAGQWFGSRQENNQEIDARRIGNRVVMQFAQNKPFRAFLDRKYSCGNPKKFRVSYR